MKDTFVIPEIKIPKTMKKPINKDQLDILDKVSKFINDKTKTEKEKSEFMAKAGQAMEVVKLKRLNTLNVSTRTAFKIIDCCSLTEDEKSTMKKAFSKMNKDLKSGTIENSKKSDILAKKSSIISMLQRDIKIVI